MPFLVTFESSLCINSDGRTDFASDMLKKNIFK